MATLKGGGGGACYHSLLLAASYCLPDLSSRTLFSSFAHLCSLDAINHASGVKDSDIWKVQSSKAFMVLHLVVHIKKGRICVKFEKREPERRKGV